MFEANFWKFGFRENVSWCFRLFSFFFLDDMDNDEALRRLYNIRVSAISHCVMFEHSLRVWFSIIHASQHTPCCSLWVIHESWLLFQISCMYCCGENEAVILLFPIRASFYLSVFLLHLMWYVWNCLSFSLKVQAVYKKGTLWYIKMYRCGVDYLVQN